jgi:periplasmic divalent cation tolerance protein
MYDICEVVVTASDPEWLDGLSRDLVRAGLVADAQITPARTIYRSHGEVKDRLQSRAVFHTRRGNVMTIVEYVRHDRPLDAPPITAVPITDGDPAYLQWVRDQTRTGAWASDTTPGPTPGSHRKPRGQ